MRKNILILVLLTIILLATMLRFNKGNYENHYKGNNYYSEQFKDTLPYQIFIPDSSTTSLPLVVYLHGAGERGNDNLRQLNPLIFSWTASKFQKENPCIILAPQCPVSDRWLDIEKEDIKEHFSINDFKQPKVNQVTKELIDSLINKYPIDKNRIYLVGYSLGAGGVWDMLERYPDYFAAGVCISGTSDLQMAKNVSVPVWILHGENDTTIPPGLSIEMHEELIKNEAISTLTILRNTGHAALKNVSKKKELYYWLLSQSN